MGAPSGAGIRLVNLNCPSVGITARRFQILYAMTHVTIYNPSNSSNEIGSIPVIPRVLTILTSLGMLNPTRNGDDSILLYAEMIIPELTLLYRV